MSLVLKTSTAEEAAEAACQGREPSPRSGWAETQEEGPPWAETQRCAGKGESFERGGEEGYQQAERCRLGSEDQASGSGSDLSAQWCSALLPPRLWVCNQTA